MLIKSVFRSRMVSAPALATSFNGWNKCNFYNSFKKN